MGYGVTDFTAGDTPGASDFDGIMRQTTMAFASTAARDSAITAIGGPAEGMRAYTEDDFRFWCYADGAWAIESEPVQDWTPVLSQAGTVTTTVNWGFYQRTRGRYSAECSLTVTGSGSAGNIIAVTTPFTQVSCSGIIRAWDDSIGWDRVGAVVPFSTTLITFRIDQGTDEWGIAPGDGLTADDVLWISVQGWY